MAISTETTVFLILTAIVALFILIGSILVATAKPCNDSMPECSRKKKQRGAGIGMLVIGCVSMVVLVSIWIYRVYRVSSDNSVSGISGPYNIQRQVSEERLREQAQKPLPSLPVELGPLPPPRNTIQDKNDIENNDIKI